MLRDRADHPFAFAGRRPALGVVAASLGLAALAYAPVGIAEAPGSLPRLSVLLSVVGLGVICTAVGFLIFLALIVDVGPVRATVITYVNPLVAGLLGVTILSEKITAGMGVGLVLVLTGASSRPVPRERSRSPERRGEPRYTPDGTGA